MGREPTGQRMSVEAPQPPVYLWRITPTQRRVLRAMAATPHQQCIQLRPLLGARTAHVPGTDVADIKRETIDAMVARRLITIALTSPHAPGTGNPAVYIPTTIGLEAAEKIA